MAGQVAIIGAGPAGLAAAAALKHHGLSARVLEQRPAIGDRWRTHYDRLHLHTTRRMSGLPGYAIPSRYGRWVSRDDFVRYQQEYAQHHAIDVELDTQVERIDRADGGYHIATSRGPIDARFVVVSTGYNTVPFVPDWPGRAQFAGELVHAQEFKNGEPYRGKRVLVIGTGNSGAEIATDLADHGAEVWWSVRTPPTILPRAVLGIATQAVGVVMQPLPPKIVDPIIRLFSRIAVGRLERFGIGQPSEGAYVRALRDHVLPILDAGIVAAIRARRVQAVPSVRTFDAAGAELADGQHLAVDAVIACTGYRPALESIVGHLSVLDARGAPTVHGPDAHPSAPGMYFLGFTPGVSGGLREIGQHARRIAREIAAATTST